MSSVLDFEDGVRQWVDGVCLNRSFSIHPGFRASIRAYSAIMASSLDATYYDAVMRFLSSSSHSRTLFYDLLAFLNELNFFFQCHRRVPPDSWNALMETLDIEMVSMVSMEIRFMTIENAFTDLCRIYDENFLGNDELEDLLFDNLPIFTRPVHNFFVALDLHSTHLTHSKHANRSYKLFTTT